MQMVTTKVMWAFLICTRVSAKFGIHESRSATVLAQLVYKRYIHGKDFKFGVNILKIKEVFGYVSSSSKHHGTKVALVETEEDPAILLAPSY